MNEIIEKCKKTRILAAIGIVGLFLGSSLPYVKFWGYRVSLWRYWEGKIIVLLALVNLLFIFKDVVKKYIPSLFNTEIGKKIDNLENPKYSLIPTIVAAVFAFYVTTKLDVSYFKYYRIGFYCMWIGTISLIAYAFLHRNDIELYNENSSNNSDDTNTSNESIDDNIDSGNQNQ